MTQPTATQRQTSLRTRGIRKTYPSADGELVVLDGIDLDLVGGDEVAIMGRSGSGKSTLLHLLGGLDTPSEGSIEVDGRSLAEFSTRRLADYRNRSVGFVFQDHHLLPQCSVLENVLLPTLAHGGASRDLLDRARWLVDRVGLSHRVGHRPAKLSGGERQRVAVARALINSPKLVLGDEPTGNLDRATGDQITDLLLELVQETKAILLVATHSAELAGRLRTRFDLVDGRLVSP